MDALAAFLDGPRARGAFVLRSVFEPPWALRVEDEAPLSVVAVVGGGSWIVTECGESRALQPGAVAILRGPGHYTVADDASTAPTVVIHPGQRCTTPDGEGVSETMALGVRSWGNSPSGSTIMLTGTYETDGEVSRRLLDVLPAMIVLDAGTWDNRIAALLADEIVKDDSGQAVVLDRLLDLLVVAALRTWFARPESEVPAWYRAQGDPIVGRALRLMHADPARQWTVASLAAGAAVSRAGFARRFNELVGEPPMSFLTGLRMALAADALSVSDSTVASVAAEVGYSSPFTFSTAFKRLHGVSPRAYRNREASDPLPWAATV